MFRSALLTLALLALATPATAGNWTREPAGAGEVCSSIGVGQICYNVPAGVTTPAIRLLCHESTLIVFGTAASVVPQSCATAACTLTGPIFASPLTGDSPNAWGAITTPFPYVRATDDNTGVTLALVCM